MASSLRSLRSEWSAGSRPTRKVTGMHNEPTTVELNKNVYKNEQVEGKQKRNLGFYFRPIIECSICGILFGGIPLSVVIILWLRSPQYQYTATASTIAPPTITAKTTTASTINLSSTITTSTITVTTTVNTCGFTCLNQPLILWTNLIVKWLFDGDYADETGTYNATPINSPLFVTSSYMGRALWLNASQYQYLIVPYVPLYMTSFTIEVWLYPLGYPNVLDHGIIGHCPVTTPQNCLFATIRTNGSQHYFYFGFYSNSDIIGTKNIRANRWTHVAFVFDQNTLEQSMYVNGYIDTNGTAVGSHFSNTGNFEIGRIQNIESIYGANPYHGYMDHLTISNRVKSSCEILEDFSFGAHFKFDAGSLATDSGPNSLLGTSFSASFISGYNGQSISFNGSTYFQIADAPCVGMFHQSFSISLWIQPNSLSGTIVHVSSNPMGTGSCTAFIGFHTDGRLAVQLLTGGPRKYVYAPSLIDLAPNWTHVVQTWSSTNGLRLYVNNVLVASDNLPILDHTMFPSPVYITLASSLNGSNYCYNVAINMYSTYMGAIDEMRVYCSELTAADICTIYNT